MTIRIKLNNFFQGTTVFGLTIQSDLSGDQFVWEDHPFNNTFKYFFRILVVREREILMLPLKSVFNTFLTDCLGNVPVMQ